MIKAMVLLKKTVLEAAVGLGRKVAGLPAPIAVSDRFWCGAGVDRRRLLAAADLHR